MRPLAFVQHCAQYGGSSYSGVTTVECLLEAGFPVRVYLGSEGPFESLFAATGCEVEVLPFRNWLGSRGWFRFVRNMQFHQQARRRLMHSFAENSVAGVYLNTLVPFPAALAAHDLRLPVLWHVREMFADQGGEMHVPSGPGRALVRRAVQGLSDLVVTNSQATARHVLGTRRAAHARVIPNCVGDDLFHSHDRSVWRQKLSVPQDQLLVVVPGTLRRCKGQLTIVEAVGQLPDEISLKVVMTGETENEYAAAVAQAIARSPCPDRFQLVGHVHDMAGLLAAADVACVPSLSESFGRVVAEAMACGCPVVASDVGGIPEIIHHSGLGWLVPAADAAAWSVVLQEVLSSPTERRHVSEAAREEAQQRFHTKAYESRITEAASRVFSESGPQVS